ncbi:MAG: hypothetical protein H0X33_00340 [Taibaiella sp.]|nr:hypothetical protein [Taibaiella sp.]
MSQIAAAQRYSRCTVYQYTGDNEGGKTKVLMQSMDKNGNVIMEVVKGYIVKHIKNHEDVLIDGVYSYQYHNNLLINKTIAYQCTDCGINGDSTKISYYYNTAGKVTREITHKYEDSCRLAKPGDWETPTDCKKAWIYMDTAKYVYDAQGRCTSIFRTGDESIEHFTYDNQGRLLKDKLECGEGYKPLSFSRKYSYFTDGYKYATLYEDNDSLVHTYLLDRNKRIIEEIVYLHSPNHDKRRERSYKLINNYNEYGQKLKTTYYGNDEPNTVHLFVYE